MHFQISFLRCFLLENLIESLLNQKYLRIHIKPYWALLASVSAFPNLRRGLFGFVLLVLRVCVWHSVSWLLPPLDLEWNLDRGCSTPALARMRLLTFSSRVCNIVVRSALGVFLSCTLENFLRYSVACVGGTIFVVGSTGDSFAPWRALLRRRFLPLIAWRRWLRR